MSKVVNVALCEGRHEIAEASEGSIFNNEVNPLDVEGLEKEAFDKLSAFGATEVNLYVTGLSVALIAVLNAAKDLGITVTLYHYDRNTGSYYQQSVK